MSNIEYMVHGNFPDFPFIPYLPWKPPVFRKDVIAPTAEAGLLFQQNINRTIWVEEKIDGQQLSIFYHNNHWAIKSRDSILYRFPGYCVEGASHVRDMLYWCGENESKFAKLLKYYDDPRVVVCGEWVQDAHGLYYDSLPSKFIAYELLHGANDFYLESEPSRRSLEMAGFFVPPILHTGVIKEYEQIEHLANQKSLFSTTEKMEGVVIKIGERGGIGRRFKFVREDFVQGGLWSNPPQPNGLLDKSKKNPRKEKIDEAVEAEWDDTFISEPILADHVRKYVSPFELPEDHL